MIDRIDEFEINLTARLRPMKFEVIVWHIWPDRMQLRVERGDHIYKMMFDNVLIQDEVADSSEYWAEMIRGKFREVESSNLGSRGQI